MPSTSDFLLEIVTVYSWVKSNLAQCGVVCEVSTHRFKTSKCIYDAASPMNLDTVIAP